MSLTRQQAGRAQDEIGIGRWLNEGGQLAPEAIIEREMAVEDRSPGRPERDRKRVLIAGGGVAGLETLLALRALREIGSRLRSWRPS